VAPFKVSMTWVVGRSVHWTPVVPPQGGLRTGHGFVGAPVSVKKYPSAMLPESSPPPPEEVPWIPDPLPLPPLLLSTDPLLDPELLPVWIVGPLSAGKSSCVVAVAHAPITNPTATKDAPAAAIQPLLLAMTRNPPKPTVF
jgi:hypothetical protein